MRKLAFVQVFIAFIVIAAHSSCLAQVATGPYPFGTFDKKGFDTINVGNLNIMFNVPILAKAGRAGLNFAYQLAYNSAIWNPVGASGSQTWTPAQNWGWLGQTEALTGYSSEFQRSVVCSGSRAPYDIISNYVYHDAFGIAHGWAGTAKIPIEACPGNTDTLTDTYSKDGKYELTDKGIVDQHGVVINPPLNTTSGVGSYTDSNGNEITTDGSGNFKDTTGNVVLSISGGAPNPEVFTYKDTSGSSQTIQATYTSYSIKTNFGCSGVSEFSNPSVPLITAITYPDGSSYQFTYENTPGYPGSVTGRIASVTLPTGGHILYTYSGGNNGIVCADGSTATLTRKLTDDPNGSQWSYVHSVGTGTAQTTLTDGLNNETTYAFVPAGTSTPKQYVETDRNVYQGAASGPLLLTLQTCYNGVAPDCSSQSVTTPISQVDTYENLNGTQERDSTAKYNSYGLQTEEENYDFGPPSQRGSLLRYEIWTYPTTGIVGLVQSDTVYDGSGNITREAAYRYDETTPVVSSGVPQHVAENEPRGNLTSLVQYANSSTSYTTTYTYEDTGSILTSVSPTTSSGATTTYSYDPTFVYNKGVQFPMPSSGVALSSGQTYDESYTGLPEISTDPNTQPTTVKSYDNMLRPTEIDYPDGGKTTASYTPTQIGLHRSINSSTSTDSEVLYDGYGRVSRVAVYNGNANPDLDWYQQDTCYDSDGRIDFKSYRYQASGFASPKVCLGAGDAYAYDALGRLTSVIHGDGTSVTYSYLGRATKTTDENQVSRITQVDGLGRTTAVCEVSSTTYQGDSPSPCNLDISGFNGFPTTYAYAGGQTTVTQGAQTRIFTTDRLGRPTASQEPESGTTTYVYSVNATGPVMTRTRPTANQSNPSVTTTTTTQYDALGRVLSISHSDGTPEKTFSYDANPGWAGISPTNLKGRLTAAYTPGTTGTIYSYDRNGRILQLDECFPSNCGTSSFPITYTYDWAGNVTYEADWVSGGIVYGRSPAGEVTSITNQTYSLTGVGTSALVSNVQNGPFGPLNWQLGNGLTGVGTYDSLGRVSGGWVCNGSSQANCTGGSLLYWFGTNWQGDQLKQLGDGALNQESSLVYDDLGRLSSFAVTSGRAGSFTYVYDRYGNRWQQNGTSGSGPPPQLTFDKTTNRINSSGYAYDAAGNMTSDGFHTYTYDAEGNVTAVDGGTTAQYVYNAMNQRVEVTTASGSYEYLYDAQGHWISQWLTSNSGYGARIYWGNQVLASRATTGYTYFEGKDWMGTERIRTDASGNTVATYTSLPFGDGNSVSSGDPNAQQDTPTYGMLDFDSESDTRHATFRQYSDTPGRWMSPDPYSGSYDINNPQSMNRYSYVLNNPLAYIDPSGQKQPLCNTAGNPCPRRISGGASFGEFWDEFNLLNFAFAPTNPEDFMNGEPAEYNNISAIYFVLRSLPGGNPFAGFFSAPSKTPCLGSKFENFFNSEYPAALPVSNQYNVGVSLLLSLAAHESGWGTSSMAINQYDPFGATPGGDSTPGLTFTSFSSAWQWWGNRFGPAVEGVGNNIGEFTHDLLSVGYNSEVPPLGDPNWSRDIADTLPGVQRRLNQWQNGAPTCQQ